jgi:limonene-1,2-epoxide hydrolase
MDDSAPLDESERLDFALGQIHGLKAVIAALIRTSPDSSAVQRHLQAVQQAAEARVLPEEVSDAFVDGMREVFEKLRRKA